MSKKRLIIILSLICLRLVVCVSYACPQFLPRAILSADPNPTGIDVEIVFDGSASYDPGPWPIKEYRWDFDSNGSIDHVESMYDSPPADGKVVHRYDTAGIKTVTFTVVDTYGAGQLDTITYDVDVDVSITAPVHNISKNKHYLSIQQAIDYASTGNEIQISAGTVSSPAIYYENIDFKGKDIILTSTNPDEPAATVINGGGAGRVVTFSGTETINCILSGFTITGGHAVYDGSPYSDNGGGIKGSGCLAAILNCVITGNTADVNGGGINNCGGDITNCLIYDNTAGYGGGIHNSNGAKVNCTIAYNTATTGGGITTCADAITNCIVWGNSPAELYNNTATFTYNCIKDWSSGGTGNIATDPMFTSLTNYRLISGSSCIDKGLDSAVPGGVTEDLDGNDRIADGDFNGTAAVDIGAYEFSELRADMSLDYLWMYENLPPGLTNSNLTANVTILSDSMNNSTYGYQWVFVRPSDVATDPVSVSGGGAADTYRTFASNDCGATAGISPSGQVFTVRVTITGDQYGNTGVAEAKFGIALLGDIKNNGDVGQADWGATNSMALGNQTGYTLYEGDMDSDGDVDATDAQIVWDRWKDLLCLIEDPLSPSLIRTDSTAPTPDPAKFVLVPTIVRGNSVRMIAKAGSDINGPVEYYFTETTNGSGGADSGWQMSPSYTDGGLDNNTIYTYTVKMRDSYGNITSESSPQSVMTDIPPNGITPPYPNPASFAVAPFAVSGTSISMTATTGYDIHGPVQYYFDCVSGPGDDSEWQISSTYIDEGLTSGNYDYTVKMKNSLEIIGTASGQMSVTLSGSGQIRYVDSDASTGGNGLSWASAFKYLQEALDAANSGDEIWVADGTYYPTKEQIQGDARSVTFELKSGVSIYGGFAGYGSVTYPNGESIRSQREPENDATTLSGDIGTTGDDTDNSYHVVIGSGTDSTAILDGFKITAGYGNGWLDKRRGAGLYINGGSPSIKNCVFTQNSIVVVGGPPPPPGAMARGAGVYCNNGSPVFENCILSQNFATSSFQTSKGGGMYCDTNSSVVMTNCIFYGNTSDVSGGGIYSTNGSDLRLTNCTFSENVTSTSVPYGVYETGGGGICNENSLLDIDGCEFRSNESNGLGYGAGVYNKNCNSLAITIDDCAFYGNKSSLGGGIYNQSCSNVTITGTTFVGNEAIDIGGGVYNISSTVTLNECAFGRNNAVDGGDGGGMHMKDSSCYLTNCVFSENSAKGGTGGGISHYFSSPSPQHDLELTNCTFSGNVAFTGAGIGNQDGSTALNLTITNSIFWDFLPAGTTEIAGSYVTPTPTVPTVTYSTIRDDAVGGSVPFGGSTNNNTDVDPLFADPYTAAGPDGVFRTPDDGLTLRTGSPCVDVGNTSAAVVFSDITIEDGTTTTIKVNDASKYRIGDEIEYNNNGVIRTVENVNETFDIVTFKPDLASISLNTKNINNYGQGDIVGNNRIVDGDLDGTSTVDKGAYESRIIYYVNKYATDGLNDGTSWTDAYIDLKDGITACNTTADSEVWVTDGVYTPDTSGLSNPKDATFTLKSNVVLLGGFSGVEEARLERNWKENATILSGDIDGDGLDSDNCYHVITSASGVTDCVLSGFTVKMGYASGASPYGGGVFCDSSSPTFENCIITDNYALIGGGIYSTNGNIELNNSMVINNEALNYGGALYSTSDGSPAITNCTIADNESYIGGAIFNDVISPLASPLITNSIIWGNTSNSGYSQVDGSIMTISFSDIEGGYEGTGNINSDPGLSAGSYQLSQNSPCVDAGNNGSVAFFAVDIEGKNRVIDGNHGLIESSTIATVDMGAYELPKIWYVNGALPLSGSGTSWANAFTDLQVGIDTAQLGEEVWVAEGTYKPDPTELGDSRDATFLLSGSVALYGGFPDGGSEKSGRDFELYPTILSGDLGGDDAPLVGRALEGPSADINKDDNCYHVVTNSIAIVPSILDGFVIKRGYTGSGVFRSKGAGIFNYYGSLTLVNCVFTENYASNGGGLCNGTESRLVTIDNCTFFGNSGNGSLTNLSSYQLLLIIKNSTFDSNTSLSGTGGMQSTGGDITVSNCVFTNNWSGDGTSALDSSNCSRLQVDRCIFSKEGPDLDPLQMNTYYTRQVVRNYSLVNIIFKTSFTNCLFSLNTASYSIMSNVQSDVTVTNCTFSENAVGDTGGAERYIIHYTFGHAEVYNCIMWDRTGVEIRPANPPHSTSTISNSHIRDNSVDINDYPYFLDPLNGDCHLYLISPCIDAGSNNFVPGGMNVDLDGQPRIMDGNNDGISTVDMGAYEAIQVVYVDESAIGFTNGTSWEDAFVDLQDALDKVSEYVSSEIWIADGEYNPSVLTDPVDPKSATFMINPGVKLYGGFAGGEFYLEDRELALNIAILSGDIGRDDDFGLKGDNSYHVLTFVEEESYKRSKGISVVSAALLDGLDIRYGDARGSGNASNGGGAINIGARPWMYNCDFISNYADNKGGGIYSTAGDMRFKDCGFGYNEAASGGGMYLENDTATLERCEFSNNDSDYGAGAYFTAGSPELTECLISYNYALIGGGIYCNTSNAKFAKCTFEYNTTTVDPGNGGAGLYNNLSDPSLVFCTFSYNFSDYGGGMYNYDSDPLVINTKFLGNISAFDGGGMYNDNTSVPDLTNCLFSINVAEYSGGGMYNNGSDPEIGSCTFSSNIALSNGGGIYNYNSSPDIVNSILWGNSVNGMIANEYSQIYTESGTPEVTYSCIQDDAVGGMLPFGGGTNYNTDSDPLFVKVRGSADDDHSLQNTSPCLNAGSNAHLASDVLDLDADGSYLEVIPYDIDGGRRVKVMVVDKGAYEGISSYNITAVSICWIDESSPYIDHEVYDSDLADYIDLLNENGGTIKSGCLVPSDNQNATVDPVLPYDYDPPAEISVEVCGRDSLTSLELIEHFERITGGIYPAYVLLSVDNSGSMTTSTIDIESAFTDFISWLGDNGYTEGAPNFNLIIRAEDEFVTENWIKEIETTLRTAIDNALNIIAVPDVTGMEKEAAKLVITGVDPDLTGHTLCVPDEISECSDSVPVGYVIRTEPVAGVFLPDNGSECVKLVVSSGESCTVDVPNVFGLDRFIAEGLISEYHEVGVVTFNYGAAGTSNTVLSQIPLAGTPVPPGSLVNIEISMGLEEVPGVPPTPDAMTWASVPSAVSSYEITMTATTATDANPPVEYYFTETSGNLGGNDSGWQYSPVYTDSLLDENLTYTYTVKARDIQENETNPSAAAPALTPLDTVAPQPDPMTWVTPPTAISSFAITMTATTATDDSGSVEYYFDFDVGGTGGDDSEWQSSATYTDIDLEPGVEYKYTVIARDGSAGLNQTTVSAVESATTMDAGSLPYMTSFEYYQGYSDVTNVPQNTTSVHYQGDWKVETGTATIEHEINETNLNYQYVYVDDSSVLTKNFDDTGSDNDYIRMTLMPYAGLKVKVMNGGNVIAAVWFDPDGYIYVQDDSSTSYILIDGDRYRKTSVYLLPADLDFRWNRLDLGYYDDAWYDLMFKINWGSDTYDVFWDNSSAPIESGVAFAPTSTYATLTDIRVETVASGKFAMDRFSISRWGPGSTIAPISIATPCGCVDEELKGSVEVIGTVWMENLGKYDLYASPVDLAFTPQNELNFDKWIKVGEGWGVANSDVLGHWDTSMIPNGYYHLGLVMIDDFGRPVNASTGEPDYENWFTIMMTTRSSGASSYSGPAYFTVNSDLKSNTFYYEEEADITVPWPGKIPFALKRVYNNNLRFYDKPYYNGWTHNHQIKLIEDTIYEPELMEDGLKPGWPHYDNNYVGFGVIWVKYPDGSTRKFRHTSGSHDNGYTGDSAVYYPYPNNHTGEKILRTTTIGGTFNDTITKMSYTLHTRDGSVFTFEKDTSVGLNSLPNPPYGNLFGRVVIGIDTMADRFGNTLNYTWQEDALGVDQTVNKISYTAAGVETGIVFDIANEYYTAVELRSGTILNGTEGTDYEVLRRVAYTVEGSGWNANYVVRKIGVGVNEDGTMDLTRTQEFTTRYNYDNEGNMVRIVKGDSVFDTTIEVEYDDYGRIKTRKDYVDLGLYLETSYDYVFYTPENVTEDVPYLKTTVTTDEMEVTTIQKGNGATDSQTVVALDDPEIETKDTTFEGYDTTFKLQPIEIHEWFDSYDRKTVNGYDVNTGDLTNRKVYVDGSTYVETDITYHTAYPFETSRTTWQDYNGDLGTGKEVYTGYVYGQADGTPGDPLAYTSLDKYLVEQNVLLDDTGATDVYAVTEYEYYPNGQIQKVAEVTGEANSRKIITKYYYDDNGFPKLVQQGDETSGVESVEDTQRFYYDVIGQLVLEATALGAVTYNEYDGFGRLWKVRKYTDSAIMARTGGVFDTVFDSTYIPSNLQSEVIYGYDQRGNRTYELLATGGEIETTYTTSGLVRYKDFYDLDVLQSYLWYDYNDSGSKTLEYKYDATNTSGSYTVYDYDSMNRLTDTVWLDYGVSPYGYSVSNIVKSQKSKYFGSGKKKYDEHYGYSYALEKKIAYEYDILDRMTKSVVDPVGTLDITTQYFYDAAANLIAKVDPKGNCLITDYDNANRKVAKYFTVKEVDAIDETDNGDVVWVNYANSELNIDATRGNAIPSEYTQYYNNSQVQSVTQYDYDHGGNGYSDGVLAYKEFTYDGRKRIDTLTEVIDTSGTDISFDDDVTGTMVTYNCTAATTEYDYSDTGSLNTYYHIQITDAAGKNSYRQLDEFGRMLEILYPSGEIQEVEFNGNGSLKLKYVWFDHDGNGASDKFSVDYIYDGFGRLTDINYPLDAAKSIDGGSVTYAYDGFGRKVTVTDSRDTDNNIGGTGAYVGTIGYTYDALGRIETVTDQDGYETAYTYTADGQKKTVVVKDSVGVTKYDVTYDFDTALRLESVSQPSLGANDLIAEFGYTLNGNRQSLTYSLDGIDGGAEVAIDYTYNADNLLVKFNTIGGPTFTFGGTSGASADQAMIDGLGRLDLATETLGATTYAYNYDYDMRSQLTDADIDKNSANLWDGVYTYGLDGNITNKTVNTNSTDYDFDYDNNGTDDRDLLLGATGFESFTLNWDRNGNMTTDRTANTQRYNWDNKLRHADYGASNTMDIVYDPAGNRISKTVYDGTEVITKYIVDTVGSLPTILCEFDVDPVTGNIGSLTKSYVYANAQILAMHDGDYTASTVSRYFYLHDRLGSVRMLIDESGLVKNTYTYKPFGEDITSECTQPPAAGTVDNPWKYTGQWFDEEINQYYLRARQYDPQITRFTTRDPIKGGFKEPMTLHAYLYTANDPINRIDSTGKFWQIFGALSAGTAVRSAATYVLASADLTVGDSVFDLGLDMHQMIAPAMVVGAILGPYLPIIPGVLLDWGIAVVDTTLIVSGVAYLSGEAVLKAAIYWAMANPWSLPLIVDVILQFGAPNDLPLTPAGVLAWMIAQDMENENYHGQP